MSTKKNSESQVNDNGFGPESLLIPGPTPLPDRVRRALSRQSIDFTSAEFIETSDELFETLKPVFGTSCQVFLYPSNGHGAWEAALVNTINAGDTVLLPETGLFSEAWRAMASALGIKCETLASDWRHGVDPAQLEQRLASDSEKRIKAVLIVHTDTASSITSNIEAISQAIRSASHPALLMVDTIASLCTTPFDMEKMGIDVAVSASQKALMSPPGLSLVAVNERALELSESVQMSRHYWCWQERMKGEHYKRFCGTAPEQLVFALNEALSMINEEGLSNTIHRHWCLAEMVRATVKVWCEPGFLEFNAVNESERANSVTTVRTPDGFDSETIRNNLRQKYNVVIGGGLGELRGSIFRIGHMGFINVAYVGGALMAIDQTLRELDIPIGTGALEAGLASYSQATLTSNP